MSIDREAFMRKRIRELDRSVKRLVQTQDRYLARLKRAQPGSAEERELEAAVQDLGERIEVEDDLRKGYSDDLDALVLSQVRKAGIRLNGNPR